MSSGATALVIVAVIVIVALLAAVAVSTRRHRLQRQFGLEYDLAVTEQSSKLRAEAELTDRQRRVRKLEIRPLSDAARRRYSADWIVTQERFVDSPQSAVAAAHALVTKVMRETGYPVEDDDQAMADLSVEHSQTVGHFRTARQITTNAAAGNADTEDLREALIHYRAVFSDLLGERDGQPGTQEQRAEASLSEGRSTSVSGPGTSEVIAGIPADDQPDIVQR